MKTQKIFPGRPLKGVQKRVRVSVTLDPEILGYVDGMASKRNISRSEALEAAVQYNKSSSHIKKSVERKFPFHFHPSKLAELCEREGIRKAMLFGSILGPHFRSDSDVDLLVEFYPFRTPSLFRMAQIEKELQGIFGNRKIDLKTKEDLSPHFRDEVIQEAQLLYAA